MDMLPGLQPAEESDGLDYLIHNRDHVPFDISTTQRIISTRGIKRLEDGTEISRGCSSDFQPLAVQNKHVPGLVRSREIGSCRSSAFVSEYGAIKAKEMTVSNWFPTIIGRGECEFIKHSANNKSLIAVWKAGTPETSYIYYFYFHFNHKYDYSRSKPSLVQRMCRSSRIFANGTVVDICEVPHRGRNSLLYVSSALNSRSQLECDTSLIDFTVPIHRSCTKLSNKYLYCCASNADGRVFATGSEDGCCVFNESRFNSKISLSGHVTSIALNNEGTTVYCGTDMFGLNVLDLRVQNAEFFGNNSVYFKPGGISELKLLSDEKSVILCDENGLISKVELHKREPVMKYEGHSCSSNRSPLSISEHNDLLCATGSDRLTRVWSLSTGKLLHTIDPVLEYNRVHSSLITHGNQWFVTLLQKDRVFIVEPCVTS